MDCRIKISLIFIGILGVFFFASVETTNACDDVQSFDYVCDGPKGDRCYCQGSSCSSTGFCGVAGDIATEIFCMNCASRQDAERCACGDSVAPPCQSAIDPQGNVGPPPVCQWGDAWNNGAGAHGAGCMCGGGTATATPDPGAMCIPWEYGMSCSCNGGTPGAPTLIAPINNAPNLSPTGITFSWNPLPNWAYGNCPFTQVKRYELHLQNQEADQWWKRSFDDGVVCVTENNRYNPTNTTPATSCTAPSATYTELIPGDLYKWGVRAENFFGKGPYSEMRYFRIPYCTISLSPASTSVMVGGSQTITANVVPASGVTIKRVEFSSGNPGFATVSPNQDSNSPYQTSARGVSAGTTTISASAILNDNSVGCSTNTSSDTNLTIVRPVAWWQVKDADVISGGSLNSAIPSSCTSPDCDPNFDLAGPGGFPGIPSYSGSYDFSADSASKGLVSTPQGWLANSPTSFKKVYDYTFFQRQVPSEALEKTVEITSLSVGNGFFNSNQAGQQADRQGYYWYHFDGDTYGGNLTIQNVNLPGSRKVILMVENANLTITSGINFTDGSGFFMAVVDGNIVINSGVGHSGDNPGNNPDIEGIFVADGTITTGTSGAQNDKALHVRGTMASLTSITLQRDLSDNSETPAEFFEYAPDMMTLYPNVFTNRKMRWKEVAP